MAMVKDACPEISVFEITLLQRRGIYQAGQPLEGYVTLVLSAPLTLHGLHLRFVGGANTMWMHVVDMGRTSYKVRAFDSEIYFDEYDCLFGHNPNEAAPHNLEPSLDPGNYKYPFEFNLPRNIPGTFEAPSGKVCYTVEAIVSRPWSDDVKCITTYTVQAHKDLDQSLTGPVRDERSWTAPGLFGCLSQPITAWLETNKKGYVAGEHIVLRGEVLNSSKQKIFLCTVSLQMIITFSGSGRNDPYTTSKETSLGELSKGRIYSGKSQSWDNEEILVPPTPVSSDGLCRIIDLRYAVEMKIFAKRSVKTSLTIQLPIIIGSAPT